MSQFNPVLRTVTAPGLGKCKHCKSPFKVGDQWYSGLGVARACVTCAAPIIAAHMAEVEERRAERRHAAAKVELEHRRAVTEAKRLGLVL